MAYSGSTLAEMRSRITDRVGGNSTFWVDVEKRDSLNEAISVWQALTGYWTVTFGILANGQIYQPVPRQIVSVQRVLADGAPLQETSLYELDTGFPGWEDAAPGVPLYWAPVGLSEIACYPAPLGGAIFFEGIAVAPHLLSDNTAGDFGPELENQLLAYSHHYLTFKEGSVELQSTLSNMQAFVNSAAQENAALDAQALYNRYAGIWRDRLEKPSGTPQIGAR
jgi:hypothetical protein